MHGRKVSGSYGLTVSSFRRIGPASGNKKAASRPLCRTRPGPLTSSLRALCPAYRWERSPIRSIIKRVRTTTSMCRHALRVSNEYLEVRHVNPNARTKSWDMKCDYWWRKEDSSKNHICSLCEINCTIWICASRKSSFLMPVSINID